MRAPVASSIAFAMAAAGGPMGGSPIPGERGREVDPLLHDHFFHEAVPEALHRAALDLSLDRLRIDRAADVVGGGVLQHAHLTRLRVDLDFGGVGAEGVVGKDLARSRVEIDGLAGRRVVDAEVAARDTGARALREQRAQRQGASIRGDHVAVRHLELLDVDVQHARGDRQQLRTELARGLEAGVARHVELAARRFHAR